MANISTDFSTWSGTAASNQPDSGDTATVQADLQAIQAALRTIFPSVNAAVTPTHTELNYVDGVTSAIQTQINAKAELVSPSFTTPILGTPTSGTLTNCTGLPLTTGVTGTLADDNGGTGQSTYSTGDTLYASGANTLAKRTIGSTGDVLTVAGGVPTWAAPAATGGMTLLGTVTTGSGATQTINSLTLTDYKQVVCHINDVSFSASAQLTINSNNISALSGAAGNNVLGIITIMLNTGYAVANSAGYTPPLSVIAGGVLVSNSAITTASTSITFGTSTGTFDGGTITVYGVK